MKLGQSVSLQNIKDKHGQYWKATFYAMGNSCECLIDTANRSAAQTIGQLVFEEATRIERLWSRYRDDSIIQKINNLPCARHLVDKETARVFEFANEMHHVSERRFDITSGVLRKIWCFKAPKRMASQTEIDQYLDLIGWDKVSWEPPYFSMKAGMEIDLGGIGKEYAVDCCIELVQQASGVQCLINFGGDIAVTGPRQGKHPWMVGISGSSETFIALSQGAIATSGDAYLYIEHEGEKLCHILNPLTGRPINGAPGSVTVSANDCTSAGMLSTLAILQGEQAESFLKKQKVSYQITW